MQLQNAPNDLRGRKNRGSKTTVLACLHLMTLSALAFAQPLFSLLSAHAEFLVIREIGAVEILALTFFLVFLLPLPLVVAEVAATALGGRAQALIHGLLVAGLGLAIGVQFLKRFVIDRGFWTLALGGVVGTLLALASRRRTVQLFLSYLSLALLAIPLSFLFGSQVRRATAGAEEGAYELHRSNARTPIILIVFDEFPVTSLLNAEGHINRHRYPNLSELADGASWFQDARAVADSTHHALPAILTGNFPAAGRSPRLANHPQNLFTLFGGDYRIWAVEPVVKLCPPEINRVITESFQLRQVMHLLEDLAVISLHLQLPSSLGERFLPPISDSWGGFAAGDPKKELQRRRRANRSFKDYPDREFRRFMDYFQEDADRALYFLHTTLPHYPWKYLPSGKVYDYRRVGLPGLHKNRWNEDEQLIALAYQRFLLQVQFVDRLIGEMMARLRDLSLFERSLIILTADHGGSFRPEDDRRFFTPTNMHDIAAVPLLIKRPFQTTGEVIGRSISSIDILPTMLDIADVDAPQPMDGRSFFGPSSRSVGSGRIYASKRKIVEYPEDAAFRSQRTVRWKLDRFGDGDDPTQLFAFGPYPELYRREVDTLASAQAADFALALDEAESFDNVDSESPLSQAWITGSLEYSRSVDGCCEIAIGINGRIEATTWTFGEDSLHQRFHVPIAESAIVPGRNLVEVFLIKKTTSGFLLERPAKRKLNYVLADQRAIADRAVFSDGFESGGLNAWAH